MRTMQPGSRISLFLKISLPLLILLLLNVLPGARLVTGSLREAALARQAGKPLAEADALRKAYEREPWRKNLLERLGSAEWSAGRAREAAQALQDAADTNAISLDGRYLLGQAYELLGDGVSAEAAWSGMLRAGGPSARAYERLAVLYRAQGDLPAAVEVLSAWRAWDPQDPRAAYLLGLDLLVSQPDAALPLLVEAAQKEPAYTPTVQILRGGISLAGQSTDPAYSWLVIGRALGSAAQWDLAQQAIQQSLTAAPQYAEAWAFLGEAKVHLGQDGWPDLEKATKIAPDSPVVRALTSLYWRRQGNYDRALTDLQVIADQEPEEPVWQVEMGNTLAEKGDLDAARACFEKATQLAPQRSIYWQYLAAFSAQYNVSIRDLGLPAARKAVLLDPNDPGALDAMGLTMMSLGDLASAERFLQRAIQKDGAHVMASLHLGQLYLQQADIARARPYLQRASSLAGDSQAGEIARRLLKQYFGE
jgi:tetratricopeptide (TPR) repeat protein